MSVFEKGLSDAIILRKEISPVPIHNLSFRFFLRMDVEFVEDHHLPVLQIVKRPLLCLAVRGELRTQGRIAGPGELNPHLAQGSAEGLVKGPAGAAPMLEYDRHF